MGYTLMLVRCNSGLGVHPWLLSGIHVCTFVACYHLCFFCEALSTVPVSPRDLRNEADEAVHLVGLILGGISFAQVVNKICLVLQL